MQLKISFHLLLAVLLTLTARAPLLGREPTNGSEGGQSGRQAASEHDVAGELAALKQAVDQLEKKIDRLADQPSEFSRVELRIVDEQGKAMNGFEVRLTSSDAAQRAKASGVSNGTGLALTRHLPYGGYRMSVSGNGWHARDFVTVEVGKPLGLTIVAPTPDQLGELVLEASLPREALEGLRFGGWKTEYDDGWATRIAPEPQEVQQDVQVVQDESSNGWKSFPTVSNGIEVVAVVVEFNIERRVNQPDGNQKTWQWRRTSDEQQQPYLQWLVQSDGTLRPLLNTAERQTKIGRQEGPFGAVASEDESDVNEIEPRKERLGYYDLKLGEEHHGQATIQLPAGQIEVSIDGIYGRPSQDALQAIDKPAESSAGQIWLPAVVAGDSKWWHRLLGDSMTVEKQNPGALRFAKKVVPVTDESQTVAVGTAKYDKVKPF